MATRLDLSARGRVRAAAAVLGAALALAGCDEVNRTVTLGTHTTALAGAAVAAALRAELAAQGAPATQVVCARKVAVYVGVGTRCRIVGAAGGEAVSFKFRNGAGEIEARSVKRQ